MGAWGTKSFESDKAQEWLMSLWEKFPVQEEIRRTLGLDVNEHHEKIRIAVYALITLEKSGLWVTYTLEDLFLLAIGRLRQIASMEIYHDKEFAFELEAEIACLKKVFGDRIEDNDAAST